MNNKSPWLESIIDTVIALIINFPLNVLLLWTARRMELGVLETSISLTAVFTIVAIVRKVVVRKQFEKLSCHSGD